MGPEGILELTGWNFQEGVDDPHSSVLVAFESVLCKSCKAVMDMLVEVAKKISVVRMSNSDDFKWLAIAKMNHSAHEHREVIPTTPWLCYWPRGRHKSKK